MCDAFKLHASETFQVQVGSNSTARSVNVKKEQCKEKEEECKEKEEERKVREQLFNEWERIQINLSN